MNRWTTADPGGLVDGPNVYQYVRGNPIKYKDILGMWTSWYFDGKWYYGCDLRECHKSYSDAQKKCYAENATPGEIAKCLERARCDYYACIAGKLGIGFEEYIVGEGEDAVTICEFVPSGCGRIDDGGGSYPMEPANLLFLVLFLSIMLLTQRRRQKTRQTVNA